MLIGLDESEALRTALLEAVANPKEESNRLRARIAEVAGGRRWSLGLHAPHLQDHPPTGWAVQGDRLASAPV